MRSKVLRMCGRPQHYLLCKLIAGSVAESSNPITVPNLGNNPRVLYVHGIVCPKGGTLVASHNGNPEAGC